MLLLLVSRRHVRAVSLGVVVWGVVLGWSSGASATTLELWLRADLGVTTEDNSGSGGDADDVSAWADQSGRGSDVGQSTVANMPELVANGLNGNPVVRFSGEGGYPSSASPDKEYLVGGLSSPVDVNRATVLAVGSFDPLQSSVMLGLLPSLGNRGYWPINRGGCPSSCGAGGGLMASHWDGDGSFPPIDRLQTENSVVFDLAYHVFANTVDKATATMDLFLDGTDLEVDLAGGINDDSTILLDVVNFSVLGAAWDGSAPLAVGDFFGGDIAEILVFDDVLTSDQLTGMTHILGERWGLTVPTASAFQIASANSLLPAIVPEPSTALLLGVGLTGLAMKRRRTRKGC